MFLVYHKCFIFSKKDYGKWDGIIGITDW